MPPSQGLCRLPSRASLPSAVESRFIPPKKVTEERETPGPKQLLGQKEKSSSCSGRQTARDKTARGCEEYFLPREGYTPRPGRWAVAFALGPHHTPFESARTARGLRARNGRSAPRTHCGAQSAVRRAKRASIRIVERYTTGTTSVFRAAREG